MRAAEKIKKKHPVSMTQPKLVFIWRISLDIVLQV